MRLAHGAADDGAWMTRTSGRVTFDPQTGQITTTTATLPDHIEARCPTCGAILLRVKLAGGRASVCVACGTIAANVVIAVHGSDAKTPKV